MSEDVIEDVTNVTEETVTKSNIELIKEYIETCPLLNGNKLNVDYLKDDIYSYSIDRTPMQPKTDNFVDGYGGKYQLGFDFTITMPLSSRAVENLVNSKFGEDFINWIEEKNKKHELPQVYGAFKIECTTPSYILTKTETTAIYIIQMMLTYYRI